LRRLILLAATAVALSAAMAGSAAAQSTDVRPEIGMEDERLLAAGGPAAEAAARQWRDLGVDVVRINARWSSIAPGLDSRRKPRGFNAANHRDRRYDWDELDRSIRIVRDAGLKVMLTVTGPGPLWTSTVPRENDARVRPRPRDFAQFSRAVATRYRDDVDRYLVWNEPNQGGWLRPQFDCTRRCTPAAPHIYRALLAAAGPQIRRADRSAKIIIGELAPIARVGGGLNTTSPLPWLREFACVDNRYRPLRTAACRKFRAPAGDVFGYHPHGLQRAPDRSNPNRNDAQLADMDRLFGALDRLTRGKRLNPSTRRWNVEFTEFGYQTSPPDFAIGISLENQARWLQHAAYITWANPRLLSLVHYQWEDEPVYWRPPTLTQAYGGWQTGLRFVTGAPKPALFTFPQPFVVDQRGGGRARLWGQVRPGGAHTVRVMQRTGSGPWTVINQLTTDAGGYWSLDTRVARGATYGFALADGAAASVTPTSGTVRITNPGRRGVTGATPASG
jgi:Cellulase (glycosyl hydrolase family 5)